MAREVLPQHVDAVVGAVWPTDRHPAMTDAALAILTTTDGMAIQALAASLPDEAMLAELVRRGRLKVEMTLGW